MTKLIIEFDSLPVWRGCVTVPEKYLSLGLSIVADDSGLMYQPLTEQLERCVISDYSRSDYEFITKPPGYSEWANYLGDQLVDFAVSIISGRQGLRILEIGGGSTYVAKYICKKFEVEEYVLMDPALDQNDVDAFANINIISDYYSGQDIGNFDVVLMFNCLEHIPDPYAILASISKIKNQKSEPPEIGLVFPNSQDQLLRHDLNVFLHEHINYFTPKAVLSAASEAGLEILSYQSDGDEFKIIFKASGYVLDNDKNVHDSRDDVTKAAERFHERLEDVSKRLAAYLDSGQTIGFHGANNGLNNFFHISQWYDNEPRILIFDGDDSKKDMYLPAIPYAQILSLKDELTVHPEILIVSAVTYYDQMKKYWIDQRGYSDSQVIPLFGVDKFNFYKV